ncbi:membrane protein [Streptomyces sp. AcH 505]|uniref:DUF3152 domain-containing protein n=1 Tax=Streptomyces sp. AcH 505 TaxID=352211 RepID=UPI0005919672|nr:membrane protein [Streptomyces sp. AcH 505]
MLLGVLVAVGLLGSVAFFLGGDRDATSSGASRPPRVVDIRPAPTRSATPSPSATLSPTPEPTPTPSSPAPGATKVPASGPGTFATARARRTSVGHGAHRLRYRVEVEDGSGLSSVAAADEIADILGAPRGWTNDGVSSFQLVGPGETYDLRVRIATAHTADALCWAGIHQDTGGEYNCEVPNGVVVNLKRWMKGSPTFDGPIHDYRALIINHEMGHFLGHQHESCPGTGQLAPVMMQQIKGLHGCVANAWPYDKKGRLIAGPPGL